MESCASKTLSDRHFLGLLLQAYLRFSIVGIPETCAESWGRLRWRSQRYGYRGRKNCFHMETGWETYVDIHEGMRASVSVCAVVVAGVVFFEKCYFLVVEVECSGLNFWLVAGGFFIELSRRHNFRTNKV